MVSLSHLPLFDMETLRSAALGFSAEALMLDVVFIALGIVVLALMGVYALALRQL